MNENTSSETSGHPLEPKLDAMLSDFFRQEIPQGLGDGELNWSEVDAAQDDATSPVTRPAVAPAGFGRQIRRVVAAVTVAALAVCAAVLIRPMLDETGQNPVVEPERSVCRERRGNDACQSSRRFPNN